MTTRASLGQIRAAMADHVATVLHDDPSLSRPEAIDIARQTLREWVNAEIDDDEGGLDDTADV